MDQDKILDLVKTFIPYFMVKSIDYIAIIVIFSAFTIPYLYELYAEFAHGGMCSLTVKESSAARWWVTNSSFTHIDTYIAAKYAGCIKNYVNDEFAVTGIIPNTPITKGYGITKPNTGRVKVMFMGEQITITKEFVRVAIDKGVDYNQYVIYAKSKRIIDEFMRTAQEHYVNYRLKMEVDLYKIHHYNKTTKLWKEQKINVNKHANNVFMDPIMKKEIIDTLSIFKKAQFAEINDRLGLPNKYAYLFYGSPGCGKTSTVLFIAKITGMPIYSLPSLDSLECNDITEMLSQLPENIIIVGDDYDCCKCLQKRSDCEIEESLGIITDSTKPTTTPAATTTTTETTITKKDSHSDKLRIMLEFMDGYSSLQNSIIILCANQPDKFDPAVIRPGRIDFKYEFLPSRREYVEELLPDMEINGTIADSLHNYRIKQLL